MRTVANREHDFIQFWFNSEKMHAPLIYNIQYLVSLCLEASVPLAFPGHQEWANLEKKRVQILLQHLVVRPALRHDV